MKYFLISFLLVISGTAILAQGSHKEVLKLMGTRFEITATATNDAVAQKAVNKGIEEIKRIEALISSWQSSSQTSEINRNAGLRPVAVDQELFDLIARSKKVSKLTSGAFDISFASMEKLYVFDRGEHQLPSKQELKNSISKIDFNSIILNNENRTVYLAKEGMRIGFGGIGKGYAANKAMSIMKGIEGVIGGVVNASGDLVVWGDNGKKGGWPIQISDPKNIQRSLGWLSVRSGSVVTSGDYERYFTNNGKRYAHIIDPTTGLPTVGIKSVTIVCPDGEVGDALATSVFVLGPSKGLALINTLKGVEVLIITDDNLLITSDNLKINKY